MKEDSDMTIPEAVRLVIWDLDETFWKGTLTEGGIAIYIQDYHDIVIELARRGIISSICSKNDLTAVREILEEKGIWEYFVFPSIDWTPKAHRIAAIIDAVQLRPQTVLFIDDNPSNRAEAAASVPGLQLADPTFIPELLDNPLFRGKNDHQLTRLAQYRLLEKRAWDLVQSGTQLSDFLQSSNITVTIEVDIKRHIDRAVELINRTNQLNFTKRRLPEDKELASIALLNEIRNFDMQAGLVRVKDNYGDYGLCGFYLKHRLHANARLLHYCFSCRVLGMGVEKWLYDQFGRPELVVVGEVVTDVFDDSRVDWINASGFFDEHQLISTGSGKIIPEVRLRGGCELAALAHYFTLNTKNLVVETPYGKDGMFVRIDSTPNMMPAVRMTTPALREELQNIGLTEKDFESNFLKSAAPGTVLILSTWGDVWASFYRHRRLDLELGYCIDQMGWVDLTAISNDQLQKYFTDHGSELGFQARMQSRVQHLRENYHYRRGISGDALRTNIREIFDRIPDGARLFVLLPYKYRVADGKFLEMSDALQHNTVIKDEASDFQNVHVLCMDEFVLHESEVLEAFGHFDRIVYFRVYKKLCQLISSPVGEAI